MVVWLFISGDDVPGQSAERRARIDHLRRTRTAPAPAPPPHPHRSLTPPQPRWTGGHGTAPRPPVTSLALGFAPSGRSPERADRQW